MHKNGQTEEYINDEEDLEIIKELLSRFPEFAESEDRKEVYDNDGTYIYFSYFGDFMLHKIKEANEPKLVERFFAFINEVFERDNLSSKIWDLFNIELLERLEWKDLYKNIAVHNLKGKALLAFQKKEGRPTI